MLNMWMLGTFLWPQTDTLDPKTCSKMLSKYLPALLGGSFLVASTRKWRLCLCQDRNWLLVKPGYTGLEGFWGSPSRWGAPLPASEKTVTGSGPEPCFKGTGSFPWPG